MANLTEDEKGVLYGPDKGLGELVEFAGRESTRIAERFHSVIWQLRFFPNSEINRTNWNPETLNNLWERLVEEGYEHDPQVGTMQALLKYQDISPKMLDRLKSQNLQVLPKRVKVEAHPPNSSINGHLKSDGFFVCDDYLRELMINSGNPFTAMNRGEYRINLDRYTKVMPSEDYPSGALGIVRISDKVHIAFTDHPIVGDTPDSRGIINSTDYYATNPKDPLHVSCIQTGIDFNIGKLLDYFREYHKTGIDHSADNSI